MAMDFFQHQENARRRSAVLVGYFAVAVALIILGVYLAVVVTVYGIQIKSADPGVATAFNLWYPDLLAAVGLGTVLLVGSGSAFKIWSLSSGGDAVAAMLNGQLIPRDSSDPDQRRLLNIVEEMAIASGIPVPPVYLMEEEDGINAFAAGYSPNDAVIGVTSGCLRLLSRDELQGVVAHEFSHILNGDMRTDIRLIGVLHGILLISTVGFILFRAAIYSGAGGRRRRGGKEGGGGALALMALGGLLVVIGYVGVFFGRLIKSALSRQREYLADASAVQFTRNPDGIAGALTKIGGLYAGSRLSNPQAEAASHMFFSNALASPLISMLATHPPLEERIKRINPAFDGNFPKAAPQSNAPPPLKDQYAGSDLSSSAEGLDELFPTDGDERLILNPALVLGTIGTPSPEHLDYAHQLHASIPPAIVQAARETYGARAVIYGMLIDRHEPVRGAQLQILQQQADPQVESLTQKMLPLFNNVNRNQRLPILDLALPSLNQLSPAQAESFQRNVDALIEADEQLDLFEYALQRTLQRHLQNIKQGNARQNAAVQYYSLRGLETEVATLISALAHIGNDSLENAKSAFALGAAQIQPAANPQFQNAEMAQLEAVDRALDKLAAAAAPLKKKIIEACTLCMAADRSVTVNEAELLRVIADSLGCPVPPFLPGQTL